MPFFNIGETLQSKTIYNAEDKTYEYKPRGFEEVEYPEYPYSEVIGFTENGDGTLTLTANVVFPYVGDSKVYAHEVVVRPLENGGVQYVSNRIIPSEDNCEETWHTPRLTAKEWAIIIGEVLSQPRYGIGGSMQLAQMQMNVDVLIAWTFIAVIIGFAFEKIIRFVEKKAIKGR